MHPAKTQTSPRSLISPRMALWITKDQKRLQVDNEDSDYTARMRRLTRVFLWHIFIYSIVWNVVPRLNYYSSELTIIII